MPKIQVLEKSLIGSIVAVFFLCVMPPCFSEPAMPMPGRMLLADEKGTLDRAKDAVKKKAQEYAFEKAKQDAKKKVEDGAKAAKKKLDDLKK